MGVCVCSYNIRQPSRTLYNVIINIAINHNQNKLKVVKIKIQTGYENWVLYTRSCLIIEVYCELAIYFFLQH